MAFVWPRRSMRQIGCIQVGRRGRAWCAVALILFGLLGWRLWCIQVANHDEYLAVADELQVRRWPVRAPRGNIYDRNGNPLALNLKVYSVAADPKLVDEPSQRATQLQPLLQIPAGQLDEKLAPGDREGVRYVRLRSSVDDAVAEAVRDLECDGIIISREWQRAYPAGHVAAALLGFVGTEKKGLAGLEAALNDELAGEDGETVVLLDGRLPRWRNQIPDSGVVTRRMVPGSSVHLTVDLDVQAIAEEELSRAVESAQAMGGTAVVMDPGSGEVLALATQPGFDPNDFGEYPEENWVSRAVVSPYEPGSTFKVVTACAAREEGVMAPGETHMCRGTYEVADHTIKCALHGGKRAHGELGLDEIVTKSCNTGAAHVARLLGAKRMYAWAKRFGFGSKTGIELTGESRGVLPPPEDWSVTRVATVGFGQGVSATPLQLLSAYCMVANGGWRVEPRVVKTIVHPSGRVERPRAPAPERVLSSETCEWMRSVLIEAVTEGTGQTARSTRWCVAGKTGTAQKSMPGEGYSSGKYIASFAGWAPAARPRLAVLVLIDEPRNGHYGAVVAAPAFRSICERALAHLSVPPEYPPVAHEVAEGGSRG